MIGYLEGTFVELSPTFTYVEVNGLGYEVQISLNTFNQISQLGKGKLYTHLQVREDGWSLYGFAEKSEKEAFQKLISISGVGANTARMMLSSLTPADLYRIVTAGDSKSLEKIKGIGGKTAQRIILELKGKVLFDAQDDKYNLNPVHNTSESDALHALLGLGITRANAEAAIQKVSLAADAPVESIIKEALKHL